MIIGILVMFILHLRESGQPEITAQGTKQQSTGYVPTTASSMHRDLYALFDRDVATCVACAQVSLSHTNPQSTDNSMTRNARCVNKQSRILFPVPSTSILGRTVLLQVLAGWGECLELRVRKQEVCENVTQFRNVSVSPTTGVRFHVGRGMSVRRNFMQTGCQTQATLCLKENACYFYTVKRK